MIFDAKKEKDAIQVGDIQKNKVSIDTNNIDFIVTILSTNLYSDTIGSFIRETVSNAWDSHKEAEVDTPVILELGTDVEGENFCRVQDFGVGLSPERFNKIYRNIGSSTKRTSNDQIGGFGIGRFSALAYSDVVYITSIFDGTEYVYLMYKDGNSISIDLFNEKETTESNGVEVKVPVKTEDIPKFKEAIKNQLVYFENLYVSDSINYERYHMTFKEENIEEEYNDFKVKKYKNFWVNNLHKEYLYNSDKVNIILGKVCYPLRVDNLDKSYNLERKYPISLTFEIGDLSVTPNREEVLYSSANKAVIEKKFDEAIEEIKDIQREKSKADHTSVKSFVDGLANTAIVELIEGLETIHIQGASASGCTLNGKSYDNVKFLSIYNKIYSTSLIKHNYTLLNNKITYKDQRISLSIVINNFCNLYFCDISKLKGASKSYIRDTFNHGTIFLAKEDNFSMVRNYVKQVMIKLKSDNLYDKEIFSLIINNAIANMKKLPTFSDVDVKDSWLKARKAAQKNKRKLIKVKGFDWSQQVNLYVMRRAEHGYAVTSDSEAVKLKGLNKKFGKLTIYADKNNTQIEELYMVFDQMHTMSIPNFVMIAPTKMKLLKNIENFVHIEDFMKDVKYLELRNIATAEFLFKEIPFIERLSEIDDLDKISDRYATIVSTLSAFYKANRSSNRYESEQNRIREAIYELCKDKNYFNEEIRGLYEANKRELKNGKVLIDLLGNSSYINDNQFNIVTDYLLKAKLIRPSMKAVLKLKKETIYNIIEEDENN